MCYKLYELYCLSPEVLETYVHYSRDIDGSMWYHKICCDESVQPLYKFIRDHGGWDNWSYRILFSRDTRDEISNVKVPGLLNCLWVTCECPVIYKIFCLDSTVTQVYVGKTINFCRRLFEHYVDCELNVDSKKVYKFIRSHGGWYMWKMERVGVYPFATSEELDHLEYIWWKRLGGQLNMKTPGCKKLLFRGDDEEFCQRVLTDGCRDSFINHGIFLDI